MDNEHARSKSAYETIKKALTINVPKGLLNEVPKEALDMIKLDEDKEKLLCCLPIVKSSEIARLKGIRGNDKEWLAAVGKIEQEYRKERFSKLKTWGTRLPAMLQSCGLLQTAAFLQDKFPLNGKNDEANIYWILKQWLLNPKCITWPEDANNSDLVDRINQLKESDLETYRLAFREAIAYTTWVKRAISVKLPELETGED